MANKKYTKEFKEDVVSYAKNYEGSIAEVARKFGVSLNTLYNWVNAKEENPEEAFVGSGNLRKKSAEEKEKDKRLRDLEMENAILKKALSIFSKT